MLVYAKTITPQELDITTIMPSQQKSKAAKKLGDQNVNYQNTDDDKDRSS